MTERVTGRVNERATGHASQDWRAHRDEHPYEDPVPGGRALPTPTPLFRPVVSSSSSWLVGPRPCRSIISRKVSIMGTFIELAAMNWRCAL